MTTASMSERHARANELAGKVFAFICRIGEPMPLVDLGDRFEKANPEIDRVEIELALSQLLNQGRLTANEDLLMVPVEFTGPTEDVTLDLDAELLKEAEALGVDINFAVNKGLAAAVRQEEIRRGG